MSPQNIFHLTLALSLLTLAVNCLSSVHHSSKSLRSRIEAHQDADKTCPEGTYFKNFNLNQETNEKTANCEKCSEGCAVCAGPNPADCVFCLSTKVNYESQCIDACPSCYKAAENRICYKDIFCDSQQNQESSTSFVSSIRQKTAKKNKKKSYSNLNDFSSFAQTDSETQSTQVRDFRQQKWDPYFRQTGYMAASISITNACKVFRKCKDW